MQLSGFQILINCSCQITVATAQAAPEGVQDPNLQVVNATALRVVWTPPDMPNGIITVYMVKVLGGNHNTVYNMTDLSFILYGRFLTAVIGIHVYLHLIY